MKRQSVATEEVKRKLRLPLLDAIRAGTWYMRSTEAQRRHWQTVAGSDDPLDAWAAWLKDRQARGS